MASSKPATRQKALASALQAQNLLEGGLTQVIDRFHAINARLIELQDAIRNAQPVASGAVCLELYPCGPKCTGCPHARWVKYRLIPKANGGAKLACTNLSEANRDPVLQLPKSAEWRETVAEMIREAKQLLEAKAKILALARSLTNLGR